MEAKRVLTMNPRNNVAVALENILPVDKITIQVKGGETRALRALASISQGSLVNKYGETIEESGEKLFALVKEVASGSVTKTETIRYQDPA